MTLYSIVCERCDERTTHRQVHNGSDIEHSIKHPTYGCWVLCDECKAGRSKADLPEEGATFSVKAQIKERLSITVDPEMIPDGMSLNEYVEKQLKDNRGELSRKIADGLNRGQVRLSGLPESEEVDGFPPNY